MLVLCSTTGVRRTSFLVEIRRLDVWTSDNLSECRQSDCRQKFENVPLPTKTELLTQRHSNEKSLTQTELSLTRFILSRFADDSDHLVAKRLLVVAAANVVVVVADALVVVAPDTDAVFCC